MFQFKVGCSYNERVTILNMAGNKKENYPIIALQDSQRPADV